MEVKMRRIHLRPRLTAAAELLETLPDGICIADIGCDHGRLSCGLMQRNPSWRCIAADVSAPSQEKARQLAAFTGLSDRVEIRCGDGLSVLREGEADAVVLCGMGGELIVDLLTKASFSLASVCRVVFQPMRGVEELRAWLYENNWHIEADRVVCDAGRLYQVFSARPPQQGEEKQPWPEAFPRDCFCLGYRAFETRDELFDAIARQQLEQVARRLKTAQGTRGEERLLVRSRELQMILKGRNA